MKNVLKTLLCMTVLGLMACGQGANLGNYVPRSTTTMVDPDSHVTGGVSPEGRAYTGFTPAAEVEPLKKQVPVTDENKAFAAQLISAKAKVENLRLTVSVNWKGAEKPLEFTGILLPKDKYFTGEFSDSTNQKPDLKFLANCGDASCSYITAYVQDSQKHRAALIIRREQRILSFKMPEAQKEKLKNLTPEQQKAFEERQKGREVTVTSTEIYPGKSNYVITDNATNSNLSGDLLATNGEGVNVQADGIFARQGESVTLEGNTTEGELEFRATTKFELPPSPQITKPSAPAPVAVPSPSPSPVKSVSAPSAAAIAPAQAAGAPGALPVAAVMTTTAPTTKPVVAIPPANPNQAVATTRLPVYTSPGGAAFTYPAAKRAKLTDIKTLKNDLPASLPAPVATTKIETPKIQSTEKAVAAPAPKFAEPAPVAIEPPEIRGYWVLEPRKVETPQPVVAPAPMPAASQTQTRQTTPVSVPQLPAVTVTGKKDQPPVVPASAHPLVKQVLADANNPKILDYIKNNFRLKTWTDKSGNLKTSGSGMANKLNTYMGCLSGDDIVCKVMKGIDRTKVAATVAKVLTAQQFPKSWMWISYIESDLNPNAANDDSSARGLWQFLYKTAKIVGLIKDGVDNRFDPEKSTEAATRYFRIQLAHWNGNVPMAIASYKWGEVNVKNACLSAKTEGSCDIQKNLKANRETTLKELFEINGFDFWKFYAKNALDLDSQQYVMNFLAGSIISYFPQKFGFDQKPADLN